MLWEAHCGKSHTCGIAAQCVGYMWGANEQQWETLGRQRRSLGSPTELTITPAWPLPENGFMLTHHLLRLV